MVFEPVFDRYAATDDVQQHQGGRHYSLYDPGKHWWGPDVHLAPELRQRFHKVLDADVGERYQHRVQSDRHQPDPIARREIEGHPFWRLTCSTEQNGRSRNGAALALSGPFGQSPSLAEVR